MKAFADLLAHCPNLKVCKLDNSHKDQYAHEGEDDSVLVSLARHCPLVEEIQLTETFRCSDAVFLLLSQNCKHLDEIYLDNCAGLTDACLEHIAKIQSLRELQLWGCYDITGAGLTALMRGCPNLCKLFFWGDCSAEAFRGLKDAPFVQSLVEILISGYDEETDQFDVIIGEALSYCHNLVTITVCNNNFGDVGLALMCAGCPKLEELEVKLSGNLTIEGLMHVAMKCPRLRKVDVDAFGEEFRFSDDVVEMFNARFPAIELTTGW